MTRDINTGFIIVLKVNPPQFHTVRKIRKYK